MMQSRKCEHVLQKTDLPTFGVKLSKRSDPPPKETKPWSDVKLPVDVLLLTLEDCEFLSCYVHLRNTYKSHHKDLGFVFFGTMGECGEEQLKVALIRCSEGSSCPDYSQITIRNAVMQLRPKAVFSVSYCVSLDPEDTKLGDVLVFSRITVNDLGTTATRDLSNLLRQSADGRNSPFLNRDDNSKFLSNVDPVRSKRVRSSSGVIASRIEGGSNNFWKIFPYIMAASLVFSVLSDPFVCEEWPHFQVHPNIDPMENLSDFLCLEDYQKRLQMICAGGKVKVVRWKKCLAIFIDDIRTQLSWFMGDRKSNGLTQPRICRHMEIFRVAPLIGKRVRGKSRPVSGSARKLLTGFTMSEESGTQHFGMTRKFQIGTFHPSDGCLELNSFSKTKKSVGIVLIPGLSNPDVEFWYIFLADSLYYGFHGIPMFDRRILLKKPLHCNPIKKYDPLSGKSTEGRNSGLFLPLSSRKSHSILYLRIADRFQEIKDVISNSDNVLFWTCSVRFVKPSGRVFNGVSPLQKAASFFTENSRNSSPVSVVTGNIAFILKCCGPKGTDLNSVYFSKGAIPENGTFRFKVNEQSSWHHCKVVSSGNGFAESSQTSFCILVTHTDQFNLQLRLGTSNSILLPRSKRQGSGVRILSTEDVLQDENEEDEEVHIVSNLFEEFHTNVEVPLCPRRCPSSSEIACLYEKLPEKPSPDACYPPNREEGLTTSESSFGFVKNQDDQREYLQSMQSSIPGDSEKEKFNGAVDPICNPQDIDASDFESSLGNHCEVQCNGWDEHLSGHQNQLKDYSDACRQSVLGLSPLTNSEKTVTGTQTEDCFGPVVANLENELAASQNICHKLQQKIKWLEEKLELCEGENHKLQADLGKYLFFEEKEKRLSAVSGRRNELLGRLVSGEATTDYDGSCSFNNPPDSTLSVMNEASKHSQVRSLSGRKTEPQEQAPGSAPDDSVALQDKHVDKHLNSQDRNGLIFYGTSLHSSSNAELFQENDTTSSEERADHEHKQCTLLPCNQSSEKTDDVSPESSMNADCHLPSSQGAVIANDYPWTSKPFDASVSSNSSQCVADSKISCDNSHDLTCFEENPKPSVGTGVDWKEENVEMSGPHAANGEERVERAVDSAGDAVSAANRPSSCETNWERLGARPKQPQHSLVAERPRKPLVSATDGLTANFLARHTQDKALQDSLYQSTGTPSPVFSENSHGTSYVDGYAPEPNRATTYCGGLSFPAETDPHRRKENPFLSALSEEFDRGRREGNFSYEHLYDNTKDADAPDGPFDSHLGGGNFSRFRNCSSKSTRSAVNKHTFQSGFVENIHVLARNNHHELVKDQSVLPDSSSAFNSEPTNTTQQHWSIPGRVSVVRPSGCTTTFEDACLAQGSTHDTSILEPRYGDADSYRSSVWNNRDFGTDSVESSDNSLLALERRVAEASALVERVLREREEREQFGREIERKEQLIREQRAKEKREREERELREAENWPQQQEAITARSQWLCEHYQRHCRVRFPCCTQFYPCHRCHNISKACDNEEAKACHATYLKCSHCQEEQEIGEDSAHCRKCGGKMSAYFCAICKHFTSIDKNPYHCDKCGICRIHQDKSFHCEVCNVCLDKRLEGNHKCRPDSGHDECCICLEDAFSGCQILPCSHKVHRECAIAMIQNGIRTCPICRHPLYSQPRE